MTSCVELDLTRALKRLGGDRELLGRLIEFVVQDSVPLVREIEQGVAASQYEQVERAAHSLKGLVSNVHCDVVQMRAMDIEAQARERNGSRILERVGELEPLIAQMLGLLKAARLTYPGG